MRKNNLINLISVVISLIAGIKQSDSITGFLTVLAGSLDIVLEIINFNFYPFSLIAEAILR